MTERTFSVFYNGAYLGKVKGAKLADCKVKAWKMPQIKTWEEQGLNVYHNLIKLVERPVIG